MSELKNAINKAGGPAAAAKACGKSVRAIYKWLAAEALPRTEYTGETCYAELIASLAAARGNEVDAAQLRASASPNRAEA